MRPVRWRSDDAGAVAPSELLVDAEIERASTPGLSRIDDADNRVPLLSVVGQVVAARADRGHLASWTPSRGARGCFCPPAVSSGRGSRAHRSSAARWLVLRICLSNRAGGA